MAVSKERQQAVYDRLYGKNSTVQSNNQSSAQSAAQPRNINKIWTDPSKNYYRILENSGVDEERQLAVFKRLKSSKIGNDINQYSNVHDSSEVKGPGKTKMQEVADALTNRQLSSAKKANTGKKKTASLYEMTDTILGNNRFPGTSSPIVKNSKAINNIKKNADTFYRAADLASKGTWSEDERDEASKILKDNFKSQNSHFRDRFGAEADDTLYKEDKRWKDVQEYLKEGYHNISKTDPESVYDTTKYSALERAAAAQKAQRDKNNPLINAENTKTNADTPKKDVLDLKKYQSMTASEKSRYNEIYGLYGKEAAEDYHNLLLDKVNQRIANDELKNNPDIQDPISKTAYMFESGAVNSIKGVGELFRGAAGNRKREATTVQDYIASGIRNDEDNSAVENVAYDIAQSTGYMAPGMLLSGGLGAVGVSAKAAELAGNTLFGLAQAGNTYRQDINEGRTAGKAWIHAGQQGIDESATNWLLGGINAFGGGALKRLIGDSKVGKALTSGIDRIAKTATGKVMLRRAADALTDMGGEAAQEYLQFYTENLTDNILYGGDNSLNPLDSEAWYAAALGALNAGLLNLPGNIVKTTQGISADVSLAKDTAEALDLDPAHYESAEDFKKVETFKKVAEEVAEKVDAGTVSNKDKIAYNEALADVLTSDANTSYTAEKINNSEQVKIRLLAVDETNKANTKSSIDAANEQWRKILNNPKLQDVVSTDGTSTYEVERNGDRLNFVHSVDGKINKSAEYDISSIGKGGDADILTVMPMQSNDPSVPELTTYATYTKADAKENVSQQQEAKENAARPAENASKQQDNIQKSEEKISDYKENISKPQTNLTAETAEDELSISDRGDFSSYAKQYSAALATKESTDNMINVWDGKDKDRYLSAYKRVYSAGFNNLDTATAEKAITNSYLGKEQWQQAYKDGLKDGEAWRKKRLEKKYEKGEEREGGITEGAELASEDQRKFLDWVGDKTGLKIEVREGLKGTAEIDLEKGVMRINPYSEDFVGAVSHELTHMLKEYAPKEYDSLQKLTVRALMKSKNVYYETLYNNYEQKYRTEVDPNYTVEDILEEITADGATAYMNDEKFAENVAKEDKSLAKKIADFFKDIAETLKNLINKKGIRSVGRVMRENEAQYRMAANTWYKAVEKAGGMYKAGYSTSTSGEKFQIDSNFEKEFDMWSKNKRTGVTFHFGTTSEALKSIGVEAKDIYMHSGKMLKMLNDHKELDDKVLKKLPNILENPIIILDSGTNPHALTMFGDVTGVNGENIMLALELKPVDRMTKVPQDYQVVLSAYKRNGLQNYIDNREIYYLDPDKKRTNEWLALNGLQLPVGITHYGSIKKITWNQAESNDLYTKNTKEKFQLSEPVEETKNLIAVRNVDQGNLESMLELEGMPSPSIAITKADIGHTQFGDVTFIFGKDMIDPWRDDRNLVFDADAWTPTFNNSTLTVERDIKTDKLDKINIKLHEFLRNHSGNTFNDTRLDKYNFEDELKNKKYNLTDLADDSYDLKLMYLEDKTGESYKIPNHIETEPYIVDISNAETAKLAERLKETALNYTYKPGVDNFEEKKEYIKKHRDEIAKAYEEITGQPLFDENKILPIKNMSVEVVLTGMRDYLEGKDLSRKVIDFDKAKAEIDSKIDKADYHAWINKEFKGVIGKKGIRNDKDPFDRNGNRRSFSQLHSAYIAENIVKALWSGKEQGAVMFSGETAKSVRGAAARKLYSIRDMHEASGRLQNISEGTMFSQKEEELLKDADEKLKNIRNKIYISHGIGENANISTVVGFDSSYDDALINSATNAKTAADVKKIYKKELINITDGEARSLLDIFNDLRDLPTDYFEAKPKRVVDWSEIKLAVVPDNIDSSLVDLMHDKGIEKIEIYPAGDNEARLEAENKATDLRFQLNIDDDPEWNYYANMVRSSSTELEDAADTLGKLLSSMNYIPSDKAIERTAKRLKKYTETDTSVEDITKQLKTMFEYIAGNNHIDGADISDIAADYAGDLITNSSKAEYDAVAADQYKRYKNAIKGYTFHLPKGFEGDIDALGGIGKLRKEFFGTLNITKDKGVSIDTMYDKLSDLYPDMFDKERSNPADQLEDIIDNLRALKPKPSVSWANEGDYDTYRYYAGQEIFKAYIAEGAADAGSRAEYQKLRQKFKQNEKTEKEMAMLQAKATEMQAMYLNTLNESKKKVTKQTMQKRVEEARVSTKQKYYKNMVIKDTQELSRWLLKPTDKKHVPEQLRTPLAEFLQNVDFSSKEPNMYGDPTQRTLLWLKLKDSWAKIAENGGVAEDGNGTRFMSVDPDIIAKMDNLTEKLKNMKRLEDLDYVGVLQLSDIVKSMKHAITSANELMSTAHYKTVAAAAENTLDTLRDMKARKDYAGPVLGGMQNMIGNQMLDAATRFHTFGPAAEDVYKGLRKGFNQKVKRTAEAQQAFKKILKDAKVTGKDINKWSSGEDGNIITLPSGARFTTAQAMSLYELLKRKQARDHITVGGVTSQQIGLKGPISKKLSKIKVSEKNKTGNIRLTAGDINALTGKLTPEQIKVADGITKYFQTTAQWGNDAAMQMYGYKKFNDPDYFPIKVDRNYLTTTSDQAAVNSNAVSIKNMGMTKSTIPHANNPLMLYDIFDVFTDQVNDMSNYEAFLVPLNDLQKWYNFKDSNPEVKYSSSIKKEIERVYGSEANAYINKFIENVNGMKEGERYGLKWLISAFKGSAVGANLSVAIQQPTAYARAVAVIDPKYLLGALTSKPEAGSWENIKKYSSIAQWKDWGFYETDIGRSMRNILTDPDTLIDKVRELQMMPAGKGDEIAWKRLWTAAELEVKDKNPNIDVKSDEFFEKVADRFDDIIDRTQVVDSTFHRVDMMRSTNDLTLMSTAFMAEPMKSYNMLYRAVFDYSNTKKGSNERRMAGVNLKRSAVAWILSNALAAMAKSIITAMRDNDDERDKPFWDRWAAHAFDEFKGNISPWNYIPGVKDIISIMQGYDVSRTDMSGFQDLYYVMNRWKKYFEGDSKYSLGNNILYSTKAVSSLTGIALYGLQRDVNAVLNTAIDAFKADSLKYEKSKLTGSAIGNKSNAGYYMGMALEAYKNGNTGLGDKIIKDMLKAGIDEDYIDSKRKDAVKADIAESGELTKILDNIAVGKETSLEDYKNKLIDDEKVDEETADSIVKSQIESYMDDKNLTRDAMMQELNGITDYSSRGYEDFKKLYSEWKNLSEAKNGWDDKDARSQLRSACTSYFKPLYQEGDAKERSRILKILSFLRVDDEKVYSKEQDIINWGLKK